MIDQRADSQNKAVYSYNNTLLTDLLGKVIRQQIAPDIWAWLEERSAVSDPVRFNATFASVPRKTGRSIIHLSEEQDKQIQSLRAGFAIQGWSIDRLCRVWLLLHIDPEDEQKYFRTIENLFLAAEMNELVALYSALPLLAYPEHWRQRCAEGIRSNIGDVLQAIMCHNPYPSENLNEPAWNQLVLKAFFTEKPVNQIIGLDKRANADLANILSDYAHERWAAHRPVNPQLWRCVGPFINERIFPDIQRIADSENTVEREAAALACWDSDYPPAKELVNKNKDLKSDIETGKLTWDAIAQKQ